jgi:hypothetical protein
MKRAAFAPLAEHYLVLKVVLVAVLFATMMRAICRIGVGA